MNARDLVLYWCELYEQQYKVTYLPNFKRECGMVKNILIKNYDTDYIKTIFEFTIANYNVYWASVSYPRPSIPVLCSWLFNQAVTKYEETNKVNTPKYPNTVPAVLKKDEENFWGE